MDTMNRLAIVISALALSLCSALAQQPTPAPTPLRNGVWRAQMPAGDYIVRLASITSVSQQEYVVDGNARVTEVDIATQGSEIARFYFIEPNVPQSPNGIGQSAINEVQDKVKEGISRAGGDDIWRKVVKNYPTSTHANTIDYRLDSKDSLKKLFDSIQDAWLNTRSGTFKP